MADTATATAEKPSWQTENELRTKELTDKLEAGVKDLFSSDKYKEYLKSMSHFHNYSSRNIMLIHTQMPKATRVASFKLWKERFNRSPKRGETALRIFAPIEIKPKTQLFEKLDPSINKPVLDDDGKPVMEEMTELTKRGMAFKLVPVFDVSQTVGEPLPHLAEDLVGNVEHYEAFIDSLKAISPLPIVFEPMNENQDGYCQYGEKIAIREGMSEIQTVSAIIHEITHARLHDRDKTAETENVTPKEVKEIEAESVSYVVCQKYGIETGANSFGYLATWGTHDLNEFKASQDTIRKEANNLINAIDDRFKILCKERGIDLSATEQTAETAPPTKDADKPTEPSYTIKTTTETIAGVDFEVNKVVPTVETPIEQDPTREFLTDYYQYILDAYRNGVPRDTPAQVESDMAGLAEILRSGKTDSFIEAIERAGNNSNTQDRAEKLIQRLKEMFPLPTQQAENTPSEQKTAVDKNAPGFYHIGSGPTETGVEVWNWNETQHMDGIPKFLATINYEREITFLDDSLPEDVKIDIKRLSTANWKEVYSTEMAGMDYDPPPPPWEKEFMPDPSISIGDRDEYGYTYEDMLPLKFVRAEELMNQDHTIFLLYDDGTEAMAYDVDELKAHEGIYGIEREDWQKSHEYRENENKVNQQQEVKIESDFINSKEDRFAIYQIMDGAEKSRDIRFEGLEALEQRGLEVNRNNYVIVHTEPLAPETTLEGIFQKLNEPQQDFSGHSLSVSDVVVLNKGGEITSHFVDRFGFSELPAFLGVEKQHEQTAFTEPKIVATTKTPKSEQPVYKQSADYALETDELQAWRDSRDLNVECGKAIDNAITASNYEQYRFDLNTAARAVIAEFGADRVAHVLASNVNNHDFDGRLTSATKDWAKDINTEKPDFHLQSHMTLIEGFADKFRKVEKEKPSLMSAIAKAEKQSKADFDGKAQPGLVAPDKSKKKTGMEV